MRRSFVQVGICLLLTSAAVSAPAKPSAAEPGGWAEVRAEHFLVVGHAAGRELESLAARLEEFRGVLRRLLPKEYFAEDGPVVVVLFADDSEYTPFKPQRGGQPDQLVAGHFQASRDVSYISLSARGFDTASLAFHEYVHSLVRNRYARAPLWLDEGMSEYYSSYTLEAGRRQVRVGGLLAHRAEYLRAHAPLPIVKLLSADRYSPLFDDPATRHAFYAQSWALVHYLLSDATGERQRQLSKYLELTGAGVAVEDALRQAFGVEPTALGWRLAAYAREGRYDEHTETLAEPLATPAPTQSRPLSEAETKARLGDLLLRAGRLDEAKLYLRDALTLDKSLAPAKVSLGLLHLQEGNVEESKTQLQEAVALAPRDHLAHYYYAGLLREEGAEAQSTVRGYAERTALIRAELKKAIDLAPDFLNAYGLLVLTDLERNPQLTEATDLLNHLRALAPDRREFKLLLAKLRLREENFAAARAELRALTDDTQTAPALRLEADIVLNTLPDREKLAAERAAQVADAVGATPAPATWLPCDMPEPGPYLKPTRFVGRQVCGRLTRIDCADGDIRLSVETPDRTLNLRADALERVRFITYTAALRGKLQCGDRPAPEPVLVTYRPATDAARHSDGELTAVEFVPEDWLQQSILP